jgi:hypothetical protein
MQQYPNQYHPNAPADPSQQQQYHAAPQPPQQQQQQQQQQQFNANNNYSQPQPVIASIPAKPKTSPFLNPPPRTSGITTSTPDEELEDGRVRNAEAVAKIRDAWIYTQISARAEEFTQYRNVSTVVVAVVVYYLLLRVWWNGSCLRIL